MSTLSIIVTRVLNLQVNVTMPAFFFDNDRYLYGTVMANYTSGAPVRGNLTLKATIRPIKPAYRNMDRNPVVEKYFNFVSDISILAALVKSNIVRSYLKYLLYVFHLIFWLISC